MKRKLLSILLCLAMALSLLPTAALAEEAGAEGGQTKDVAQTNGTGYETLQAAIDAAAKKATVTLLANTKENVTISTYGVTLDLNGFTLNGSTGKREPALTVNNTRVTIMDSSEAQTGTIMREDTAENSDVSSHYVIDVQGKNGFLLFKSGTVTNGSGAGGTNGASLVRIGTDDQPTWKPQLTIEGGTFTQDNFIVLKVGGYGTLYVKGGTINSKNSYAVENWSFAVIKDQAVVNGKVSSWTYQNSLKKNELEIRGGTVNGDVEAISYDGVAGKQALVSISGGTVNGRLGTYTYSNGLTATEDTSKSTIKITGGTFSSDPSKYVVEDSAVTKNEDNTFGVAKAYLAKVGETSYYTMDEAFKAQTASGEAIVLLRDYTTGSTFNSGTVARTVDLNGHTWTCTGTDANSAAFEINNPNASLTVKNGKIISSQLVGLIPSAMGGTIKYDNSSLTFENVEMSTTATSGIETNGNNTNDSVTLRNSTLNVPNGFGIYFPSSGTLTIDSSTINAKTMGVQVCAGSLSINAGSAITVSGDAVPKTEGDGAIQDGAAISIVNRNYPGGTPTAEITGGTFTAKSGNAAIKAYDWKNNTASDFTASDKVAVSGGTFSSDVSAYVPNGYIYNGETNTVEQLTVNNAVAKIEDTPYKTLAAAVAAAQDGDTITLLKDTIGSGIGTYKDPKKDLQGNDQIAAKGFTIDFNQHTYSVDKPAVGSETYETQGFHLEWKGSVDTTPNITLKNGTLNVAEQHDPNLKLLIQNYCNLTLDNMTVDGTNLTKGWGNYTYVTSNCNGTVKIKDTTIISKDPTLDFAFDVDGDHANRPYGAVSLTIEGNSNISGRFEFNTNKGGNTLSISGGYFTSDPSAYVADSYISVTSDKSGYDYMVVEKTDTGSIVVKPAVAEPEVKVSDNIQNKEAVEAAAKTVSAPTLSTAAADEAQKIDEAKATELVAKATDVTGETSTKKLYVQTALKVEPTAYSAENKTLTLDITPQYRVVASTADKADEIKLNGDDKNAQVVQDYQKLTITAPTEISMQLPDGFATAGNKLSIKHIKDNGTVEYYTGTVSEESSKLYVTFTTKGFSPFTISAPAASIGETMYPTLAEAIAKAANGNTVKLEKNCEESVTVSGKSLTIDKNNYVYDFTNVTVDSNSTKTENGDTLTITYTAPSYYSGSSSDPTYSVSTPSKTEHGTVTVSPKSASKGDTVTVTVKPDSGYVLETLTVTDKNGNELTLKDKGNGKYTFTMPAGKVEVKATFMEDNSMLNFFYDVPNDAYFYEAVKWAVKNGITTGVGNDLFAPEQPCTRAQIVTFLWRAAGAPEPKGAASGMTDVVSGSYYEKAVAWAIENGITTGTTTSTFSPDVTCTRAQAVTFLARALNAKAASAAEFSDVPTDSYFADAVAWAAANGVTEGIGGGLFGSDNDCTRGQIVTFLYRAYNK